MKNRCVHWKEKMRALLDASTFKHGYMEVIIRQQGGGLTGPRGTSLEKFTARRC